MKGFYKEYLLRVPLDSNFAMYNIRKGRNVVKVDKSAGYAIVKTHANSPRQATTGYLKQAGVSGPEFERYCGMVQHVQLKDLSAAPEQKKLRVVYPRTPTLEEKRSEIAHHEALISLGDPENRDTFPLLKDRHLKNLQAASYKEIGQRYDKIMITGDTGFF